MKTTTSTIREKLTYGGAGAGLIFFAVFGLLPGSFLGGVLALSAGACWAVASILFSRIGDRVTSLAMNLAKGLVGLICLSVVLPFIGLPDVSHRCWLLL